MLSLISSYYFLVLFHFLPASLGILRKTSLFQVNLKALRRILFLLIPCFFHYPIADICVLFGLCRRLKNSRHWLRILFPSPLPRNSWKNELPQTRLMYCVFIFYRMLFDFFPRCGFVSPPSPPFFIIFVLFLVFWIQNFEMPVRSSKYFYFFNFHWTIF